MFENLKKTLFWKSKSFDNDLWDYSLFDDIWNEKGNLQNLSKSDYLKLYTGWSYVAVSTIANEVAKLEKQIFWSEQRTDKLRNHKYSRLITRELLVDMVSYLYLTGSVFILKKTFGSTIEQLTVLRADRVIIKQTDEGEITWYKYFNWKRDENYLASEVIAIHLFNPYQSYPYKSFGISPIQAIAMQGFMDQEIINWNYSFFKNGASIGSVMETDKKMEPKNRQFLINKLKSEFIGSKNAHALAILDQWLKLREIKPWQREMDFVEQRRFTRDEILWIFKVPKAIIWLWEGVNVWNVEAFEKIFASKTILPIAMQIEEAFNNEIFRGQWYFKFVWVLPVDEEKIIIKYNSGLITKNEARLSLNYPKMSNWDVFVDWENWKIEEEKSIFSGMIEKAFTKSISVSTKWTDDFLEKRWTEKIARTDDYEKEMAKIFNRVWSNQEKQVLWKLSKWIKGSEEIEKEDDLWNEVLMLTLYTSLFTGFFSKIMKKEGDIAIWEVGDMVFDSRKLKKFIYRNILRFWKDIDKTTKKSILTIIKKWKLAWLSAENIWKQIKEEFRTFKVSRIKAITRSEISRAVSESRLEAWSQAGIKKKKWYTAKDERVCPICKPMDWKIIAIEKPFYKKGDTSPSWYKFDYEDVRGAPAHTSCRCDIVAEQ